MNVIDQACREAVKKLYRLPTDDGNCLAVTRIITEMALGWPSHEVYSRIVTTPADWNTGWPNWRYAADAEASIRARNWDIETGSPLPGDWVFSRVPDRRGHVGIVFAGPGGKLLVLENTAFPRGSAFDGCNRVTALEDFDRITTIGRLPVAWTEKPDPEPVPAPKPVPEVVAKGKVRVFSAASGKLITTTTIIGDKVYIPDEFLDPRYRK